MESLQNTGSTGMGRDMMIGKVIAYVFCGIAAVVITLLLASAIIKQGKDPNSHIFAKGEVEKYLRAPQLAKDFSVLQGGDLIKHEDQNLVIEKSNPASSDPIKVAQEFIIIDVIDWMNLANYTSRHPGEKLSLARANRLYLVITVRDGKLAESFHIMQYDKNRPAL